MKSIFKKILKYFLYLLGGSITVFFFTILGVWLKYSSIVSPVPANKMNFLNLDPMVNMSIILLEPVVFQPGYAG